MARRRSFSFKTKEEWLEARRSLITASDSRAILGVGFANESPFAVWASKVGESAEEERNDIGLQIGLIMEEPMVQIINLVTGRRPKRDRNYRIRVHREYQWMGATLDAWDYEQGTLIPYEFKWVGSYNQAEWADGSVPIKVQVQVQHQIAVCDAPYAYVCATSGGMTEPHIRRVDRDDQFIEALINHLIAFRRYVTERVPPPVDETIATAQAIYRLHPDDNGIAIDLPRGAVDAVDRLRAVKDEIKTLEGERRHIENSLKLAIGDNTAGVLPDGSCVTWKTQDRREHVVAASKCRVLRVSKSLPKGITYDPAPEQSVGVIGEQEASAVAGTGNDDQSAGDGDPRRLDG